MASFVADFMRSVINNSDKRSTLTMILGVIIALTIVFSQTFYFNQTSTNKSEVKTENSSENSSDSDDTSSDFVLSKNAVSSPAIQLNVQQVLHFISDIHFDTEEKVDFEIISVPVLNKLFKALFNSIISPNAP